MHQTSTVHERPTPPAQILIVDADPGFLETLSDSVTGLGHTICHAAEPGQAALDLPAGARPDLALIGLDAGRVAGRAIDTAEQVAERFGAPIVFATETTEGALLERAQRTHPHGYVLKSAGPRQLGLTLRAALGRAARERGGGTTSRTEPDGDALWNSAILASLFDRMSDAVIVADVRGRFVAVNAAARQISNTYDPARPESWSERFDVYRADGHTRARAEDLPLTRAIRGETTREIVIRLRPQRPEWGTEDVWLSAVGYPILDGAGEGLGGVVVLRHVTGSSEQWARVQKAEAELHERVQVLDAIIRSMGDGVVVADANTKFSLFNPSAERILGVGMTDRPADEWTDLYGVFYADGSTAVPTDELPLLRAVRGETVEDLELFIRNPRVADGVYISVNASPVRSESREVVGGVAVFRDVSERKMEQEALAQAFAHGRLEVIDTVLHNIGNAINSVATGVDTLHGWFADSKLVKRLETLADLVDAHERDWTLWLEHDAQGRQVRPFLLSLVRDLAAERRNLQKTAVRVRDRVRHIVDIIRTQESFTGGTVERQQINLPRAINEAVRVIQESFGRRGGVIEVDCSQAPAEILVQESRFLQMIVNLLKNAMEAIAERAERLENDPGWRPAIRLQANRAERKDFLVIDIIDNGIGIDPSRLRSVFNAGYTTKKNGSGLGLHSAANFVIGSGGSIHPLSAGIGRGTTMRVTLRIAAQPQTPPAGEET